MHNSDGLSIRNFDGFFSRISCAWRKTQFPTWLPRLYPPTSSNGTMSSRVLKRRHMKAECITESSSSPENFPSNLRVFTWSLQADGLRYRWCRCEVLKTTSFFSFYRLHVIRVFLFLSLRSTPDCVFRFPIFIQILGILLGVSLASSPVWYVDHVL